MQKFDYRQYFIMTATESIEVEYKAKSWQTVGTVNTIMML